MARRTVEEHAAAIAELLAPALTPTPTVVPLAGARGRVAFTDVRSPVDLPLFRNSQMDGIAVRAADVASVPARLPLRGTVPAGATQPPPLDPGTAVRIMTGAPVPGGADTVVPVEETSTDGTHVVVHRGRGAGEYVREPGSDVTAGEVLVPAGTLLAPRHLAALAAAGLDRVTVRQSPHVAVLTTGDELIEPGTRPSPGQLFDANATALDAACAEAGAQVVVRERTADDPAEFGAALARAVAGADVVLTSGGISQGEFEVVRQVVGPTGGWVGSVAMQPGGPQATAVLDGVPVVCFPGNPVSTQVSFAVFVRPLLRAAAGLPPIRPVPLPLADDVRGMPGKRQFRRGRVDENGRVSIVAGPGSHLVAAMAASDVLVPVDRDLAAGETVEVIPL
ncbi:gephyrin-like molybdotransferase Glp [Naasia sp. SYSU D00057]|uniref:molybdopterin molybdotransferase MoeA n=1 Tax=Naasia sp. SYSU D00057 TaxID=2817380 RepID=UPI001B30FA82|nr:gephyrin-like molybdotransferase Glp [Naasia sp. SYSU D00057]